MHTSHIAQVKWLFALFLIATGVFSAVARGEALVVRGAVSGQWSAPTDTVVIDSFAWVAVAETLRISPGMVIAFSGRFSLVVEGTLLAEGLDKDSIRVQRLPYHASTGHLGIRFRGTTTVSKLNKVLFEDGFANLGDAERYGGALELYFAEVEIDSCTFKGNRARIDGGAIYCREAGQLTVRDCEFIGDSTRFGGGGAILARTSGFVRLMRCRFVDNKVATSGGAVVTESGVTPEITDCYFARNIAVVRAGALHLRSSPVGGFVRNCVIEDCAADQGGGIYLDNSRCTLDACSVRYCKSRVGGGISARGNNNTTTLSKVVISNNFAGEDGGGLNFTENARCILTNSLVFENTAMRGGGLYCASGTAPTIRFSTLYGNTADEGSAISFNGGGLLSNSIVTGSDSLIYVSQTASVGMTFSNIYSDAGHELTGFPPSGLLSDSRLNVALVACDSLRNISVDAEFVNASGRNFRLAETSLCLFGADTSNAEGADFAGNLRVAPVGSWPDIGAFESTAQLPNATDCIPQRGVWYPGEYVIGCSLRVAVGDTLVIMAGSRLLFAPGANLHIEGTVLALGTERDSIIFDRYFELPGSTWGGITLHDESHGSNFEHCVIRRVEGRAAVDIRSHDVVFSRCTFSSNRNLDGYGGAVYSSVLRNSTFDDCRFVENHSKCGGAVYVSGINSQFRNCLFEDNVAYDPNVESQGLGGAMWASHVSVTRCRFFANRAYAGGAVSGLMLTLSDCEFDSCRATLGGAIYALTGSPIFDRLHFRNNFAKEKGGALFLQNAECMDHSSTYSGNHSLFGGAVAIEAGAYVGDSVYFSDNHAELEGGAIWFNFDTFGLLSSSTLVGNRAMDGGAVYGNSAGIDFEQCLLDSNYATRAGGAIYLLDGGAILRRSTCVNQRSSAWGSVIHARASAAILCNSVLFADNGDSPIIYGDVTQVFEFCMSDVGLNISGDSIGTPLRVNFNGDSCDARMNLIAAPDFVNPAQRDYHLLNHSKAIHSADSLLPFDADETRADIGLFSGVRPYQLPQTFNLVAPEDDEIFMSGDSITFVWNEARDDDPGDVVRYQLRLVSRLLDSTIQTDTQREITLPLRSGKYTWWVEASSLRPDGVRESFERRVVFIEELDLDATAPEMPREFALSLAGPNPFNSTTRLQIALPHSALVMLVVYDVLGREVLRIDQLLSAGLHILIVDGSGLSSGVYWAEVRAGENFSRVKLLMLK